MSDSVGRVELDLGFNYNQFGRELNRLPNQIEQMGGFRGVGKKIGLAIGAGLSMKALWDFGGASLKIASNLQEVQNVVDVTFGQMAGSINTFADTALDKFGLSELSAKQFSSSIGAMFKSSDFTESQAASMAQQVTSLTGDFASFYNLSGEEAFTKISAGLAGETEGLRRLGYNLSVANLEQYALQKGTKKSWEAMTQQEQTLTRLNFLLDKSKDAQGDFARTSTSWANQTKILSESFKEVQASIGSGLIMALTPALNMLNLFIAKLNIAASYFKAFVAVVTGNSEKVKQSTGATTESTKELSNALGSVGSSAKKAGQKAKSGLSAFDQLNVIAQSTSGAMDDIAAGMAATEIAPSAIGGTEEKSPDEFMADIKSKLAMLKGMFDAASVYIGSIFGNAWSAISLGFSNSMSQIEAVLRMVFGDIVDFLTPIFEWYLVKGLPLIASFTEEAANLFFGLLDNVVYIFGLIWSTGVKPTLDLLQQIFIGFLDLALWQWNTWGIKIFQTLSLTFQNITNLFSQIWTTVLAPIWTYFLDTMSALWDSHFFDMFKSIGNFIGQLVFSALEIYNKFISPILGWLVDLLGPVVVDTFKWMIDKIGNFMAYMAEKITGTMNFLSELLDFVTNVFAGDWEAAWQNVVNIFGGIWEGLKGIVKGVMNSVIDMVNGVISPMIRAINSMIRSLNSVTVQLGIPAIPTLSEGNMKIPRLAAGGLVYGPTLAMVGDNKRAGSDPEVIAPLSKLQMMLGSSNQAVVEVLLSILAAIESQETTLEIDGDLLAKKMRTGLNKESNRVGRTNVTIGGGSFV